MSNVPAQSKHLNTGAIILAAGSAARIRHRPKCLLELDGEPLIQRMLSAILSSGIEDIAVVLGHYAADIKPIVTKFPVALVHNPAPDAGQNSSLHCGLRALPARVDTILIALADQPLLDANDIGDLLNAYRQRPSNTAVMVPTVRDLPGNPVLFSAEVGTAILENDHTFGCKQWQLENADRVYRWPTPNEHYRIDIDTDADIEAFTARTGLHLQWPASI